MMEVSRFSERSVIKLPINMKPYTRPVHSFIIAQAAPFPGKFNPKLGSPVPWIRF